MLSCRKQPSLKPNLFTVRVSFGMELHCGVVRMLTLTSLLFLPLSLLVLFFFFAFSLSISLCSFTPCVNPSPIFTFVLAQDPGGLRRGPRVLHRQRILT